jgi:hypothetical protein
MLGAPAERTPIEAQEADGAFVTTWRWPARGVEVGFAGESERGPFRVSSLALRRPSSLRTNKGIGLGATPAAIAQAYGVRDTHLAANHVLVGSPYGGLLFELEAGRVSSIFIGASAE